MRAAHQARGEPEGSLLIEAKPLRRAEELCRRLVSGVRVVDGALVLEADPAWAGAISTVLVKKGLKVSELHCVSRR
jgi:hypothetical protein